MTKPACSTVSNPFPQKLQPCSKALPSSASFRLASATPFSPSANCSQRRSSRRCYAIASSLFRAVDAGSVIVTDEQFGQAAPIMEEIAARSEKLILPPLRRGFIVLVQGFSGATLDGITTTMGQRKFRSHRDAPCCRARRKRDRDLENVTRLVHRRSRIRQSPRNSFVP